MFGHLMSVVSIETLALVVIVVTSLNEKLKNTLNYNDPQVG